MKLKYLIPGLGIILFHTRSIEPDPQPLEDDGGFTDFLTAYGSTITATLIYFML